MAKKKTGKKRKKAVKKKVTKTAKKTKKKVAKKKSKKAKRPRKPKSLGRPKVTGDEKLYWLFHDVYDARQVFEFLRVETVRELEEYTPQQIFRLLTQPMRDAVDSIRRGLAEKNRHLADDLEFALEHKADLEAAAKAKK